MTDPEKPAPENIAQALAAVMQEVGYVQKKKQGGVSYTFASESDFIQAIRPWFLEYGIVIHPAEVSDLRLGEYQTDKGRIMLRTVVIMTYRFTHAPSDTHIDVMVTGEGADIGDKSANKALTGAYKYALRQALLIETGDDPDKSPSEGPEPLKKQYTDGDRDRMGDKFRKRVTKRPEKPAAEKDDLAQRAYASAFEAESTNAQILWDRAQLLQQRGRSDRARAIYRRIAEGTWQPNYRSLQDQAERTVQKNGTR